MLTVHLHLTNGDTILLEMSLSEKNRFSRTLNQATLPSLPFVAVVNGMTVEIPWRSVGYVSSCPRMQSTIVQEAAD
ncbi:hypothetical protein GCM10008955_41680 [Deinococcus malanensis]|uniref:DUF2442 domain-containing protein n=1 Tax=Deinococcus malanensis TaxID=1706855 RepID=A0ABQ2F378_9DEIO|nr:hypothetical protein [Deinococcus malanensis]GGK43587.1 hypothetical protein GCM10008955_41680 [Deinococcus malanensis]